MERVEVLVELVVGGEAVVARPSACVPRLVVVVELVAIQQRDASGHEREEAGVCVEPTHVRDGRDVRGASQLRAVEQLT